MNIKNDNRNSIVAIALLKSIVAVPAITIMLVSCSDIRVFAFMSNHLYFLKFQYISLLPFSVDEPAVSIARSTSFPLQYSVTVPISSLISDI